MVHTVRNTVMLKIVILVGIVGLLASNTKPPIFSFFLSTLMKNDSFILYFTHFLEDRTRKELQHPFCVKLEVIVGGVA